MLIYLSFLSLFFLVSSYPDPRKEKISACLFLVHLKISTDKDRFEKIFVDVSQDQKERVTNKVVGEMVLNCVQDITPYVIDEIQSRSNSLTYKRDYDKLLSYNKYDLYGEVKLTPEQMEIMKIAFEQSQEMLNEQFPEEELEDNDEYRKQKLSTCLTLSRYKVQEDDPIIKQILQKMPKDLEEKITNKIIGDILMTCMDKMTNKILLELSETSSYADLTPEHKKLLEWDKKQFKKNKEITFTQKHFTLFEEVTEVQKEMEKEYQEKLEKEIANQEKMRNLKPPELAIEETNFPSELLIVGVVLLTLLGCGCYFVTREGRVEVRGKEENKEEDKEENQEENKEEDKEEKNEEDKKENKKGSINQNKKKD
ncbi:unnamed protein product [Blepharisma stoltei]|uniref:Uncharacterized protein n=1 Tax=Blepharisma stoltei TaxID=1481888 RepID=A0AAU9JSJ1_9CILI|nr:unnamed protein product [Blepharisma stoltei]